MAIICDQRPPTISNARPLFIVFFAFIYIRFKHSVLRPHLFRLSAMVLLYAPSHRQDNTYHGYCYTSRGALAGTRNSSTGPP